MVRREFRISSCSMPLVYQHNINEDTRLGIWHITEPEDFFQQRVPVKKDVSHPHKRLQHLAGRYLLPALFKDFPLEEIQVADTRKPFLHNEQYHFSISHCGHYAAAIVSATQRVGVDIELVTPKIDRVKHKFVSDEEWALVNTQSSMGNNPPHPPFPFPQIDLTTHDSRTHELTNSKLLTMLWSCKEAIYKWYSIGQLDFRQHMQLQSVSDGPTKGLMEMNFLFTKQQPVLLPLHGRFLQDISLAWLYTS